MPIRFQAIDGCVVFVQNGQATEDEWDSYLTFLGRQQADIPAMRVLVIADVGPTPKQRAKMDAVTRPYIKTALIAVVTRSTVARGVVHAMRLFFPAYKPFEPSDIASALAYLQFTMSRGERILSMANRLSAELGLPALRME
jgi:hypothetical protein